MADVFYCFVAVVYHEGILIYLFSQSEKFFYSFVPSWSILFIAFLLLISTPLALLSFVSIVPCAVSASLLFFIYYFSVSLSFLLGLCA